jgi:hypothetical protein
VSNAASGRHGTALPRKPASDQGKGRLSINDRITLDP